MQKQIINLYLISAFIFSGWLPNFKNSFVPNQPSEQSSQQLEPEYHLRELIYLGNGDGDREVGILHGRSEEIQVGPAAVALSPDNQVYILDTVNYRILEYKGKNDIQETLVYNHSIRANSLAVSRENFYLNDIQYARVIELSPENDQINVVDYSSFFAGARSIYVDSQNKIFLSGYQLEDFVSDALKTQPVMQVSVNLSKDDKFSNQSDFINTNPENGLPTRSGIYRTRLINRTNQTGMFIIESEKTVLTVPIKIQDDQTIGAVSLIDVDGSENYYLKVEGLTQIESGKVLVDSRLLKFERNGTFITEVDLFDNSYTTINQSLAISTCGDIYQLFSDTNGVHLFQWTTNPAIRDQTLDITFQWDTTEMTRVSENICKESELTEKISKNIDVINRSTITRDQVIANAQAYRSHVWTVGSSNYYGRTCSNGCPVGNAKWPIGTQVTGVAYQWGGEDSISVFDSKLSQGYIAGDVTGTACVGNCATGVDCSGFVTNTWQSSRFYTTTIQNIASEIPVSDIKKGDAFNKYDNHVVLFSYFDTSGNPIYYESQWDWAKVILSSGWSALSGYTPYRYNNIIDGITDCNSINYNGIILFADKTCNGDRREFNTAGFRNLSDFNDRTSSIYVGSGWSVRVYEHDLNGGLGSSRCINGSMWDLYVDYYTSGNTGLRIEDTISAIDVFQNTSCTGISAPQTPENFRITGSNQNSISMAWNDTSNETGYRIYEWNGVNFYLAHTLAANITSFTDSGLNCGTDYFYELSAFNSAGESAHAGWSSGRTAACPALPTTPSSPVPADNTILERNTEIQLSWSTTGTSCNVHLWGGEIDINPSGSCSGLFLGNQRGGDYSWQVTATNSSGSTSGPVWHFKIKPYAPTNITAISQTTQVTLNWTLSSDEPANIDGYNIYYSNGNLIGGVNRGVSSYTVTGLTCNTQYSFFVRSLRQGVLSNNSNTVSVTTNGCVPSTPSNLRMSTSTQTSITMAWDDVSNEDGYNIYEWNGEEFVYLDSVSANVTSYTDTRGSCGWSEFYEVSSYNQSGESAHTAWVQGYTKPCTPTLSVPNNGSSNPSDYDLTYQWYASPGATEYLIEWWGGPYNTMQPCGWSSSTSCHIGIVAPDNTYSWHVKGRNSAGESPWSETWTFSILPEDTTRPSLSWVAPVTDQNVFDVAGQIISLEVDATDTGGIDRVVFMRWDYVNEETIIIGTIYTPPHQLNFATSTLLASWNQVDACAYDNAGNCTCQYIWLNRVDPIFLKIYLPLIISGK